MTRLEFAQIAEKWKGAEFVEGGCHNSGCDCLGLVIGIIGIEDQTMIDRYLSLVRGNYIDGNDEMRAFIDIYRIEKNPEIGDIALFSFNKYPNHIGIITNISPMHIIHAYKPANSVVETTLNEVWKDKIQNYLRLNMLS